MNNNILITKKELRTSFRDKKTMIMLLAFSSMITVLIFLFGQMSTTINATKYDIGINYDLNSTEKSIMSELNLNPPKYENLESMKDTNKKGKISVYIYYDKDKNLYTVYSNGDMNLSQATNNATAYLESYNTYLGDLEIKGEDLDPGVIYGKIKNTLGEELEKYKL